MKTFVLGLTFLGFTILMHSQNEVASTEVNQNDYVKSLKGETTNPIYYYHAFEDQIISERARKFQNLVANYDIKQNSIYSKSEKSKYNVVFAEGENQIEAQFNQEGVILQCKELFKDIKLPYAMSSDIAKTYPGWKFCEVTCEVLYILDSDPVVVYKVTIQNGNKRKTLRLNAAVFNS